MMFLTIEHGKLVRYSDIDPTKTVGEVPLVVTDVSQVTDDAVCSSSLDFPEEYTQDPAVIKLCRELRGNGVVEFHVVTRFKDHSFYGPERRENFFGYEGSARSAYEYWTRKITTDNENSAGNIESVQLIRRVVSHTDEVLMESKTDGAHHSKQ